jgi:hypothetical protein
MKEKLRHSQIKKKQFIVNVPALQKIVRILMQNEEILDSNWNPHIEIKNTDKGNCVGKYKNTVYVFCLYSFI